METAFVYLLVVIAGSFVVSVVAKSKNGATENSRSIAVGTYDIIAGVMMLIIGFANYEEYLPKDEQALYKMLQLFGGIWIALGLIQIGFSFFAKCLQQEIDNKVDDRLREQRQQEREDREAGPAGGWHCVCGRHNARNVSTCSCGKNKREVEAER